MARAAAALLLCSLAACTLLASRDGLVGPPDTADASTDDGAYEGQRPGDGAGDRGGDVNDAAANDATASDATAIDATAADGATGDDATADDATAGADGAHPGDASTERDAHDAADGGDAAVSPVVLYDRPAPPLGITLAGVGTAGERVCWVEGQAPRALLCAPAAGGGSPTPLQGAADAVYLADAFDLVLDATYVYWSTGMDNRVVRKALPDGGAAPYYTGDMRVSFLALDGTDVWATDFSSVTTPGLGNVILGPASDASLNSTVIYPGQSHASGVAVYASSVFWGRDDALAYGAKTGMPMPNEIRSPGGAVGGVAADPSGNIYFVVGDQAVWRVVQGAMTPELFYAAEQPFGSGDVAADDAWVYWTEPAQKRVVRLAK